MRTSKPISTISYNSEGFLEAVLTRLVADKVAVKWYYVRHEPEEDEHKAHFHVYIEPNKLVDTAALSDKFIELDPAHPDKPLKCISWRSSKLDDWLPYSIHDPAYLASKAETRVYQYTLEDVKASDKDELEHDARHAFKASEWSKQGRIVKLLSDGIVTPIEAIETGLVPLNQAAQLKAYIGLGGHTRRSWHPDHEQEWVDMPPAMLDEFPESFLGKKSDN